MSNSGKIWDTREAYKQIRANTWSLGSRGLFMGGQSPSASNVIDFIDLNHTGNAVDFGDLATAGSGTQASNSIRAIKSKGGATDIDYVTMATKGNAADFGNMIDSYGADASASNETRACYVGGYSVPTFSPGWNINRIEYVNLPTLGNMADFGDLTQGRANQAAGSNGTRGIFAGGYNGGTVSNTDYITMATTGNAIDFGDLSAGFAALSSNSPIRLYCAGGQPGSTGINYFTFSTLGNSLVWGDLPVKGAQGAGSASHTRGIFQMGEAASPLGAASNRLESISMTASGNSTDFGDLTVGRQDTYCVAAQGHGGLQLGFAPRSSVTYMPGSGRGFTNAGTNSGGSGGSISRIQMILVPTLGNALDFGDLTAARQLAAATNSVTRSCVAGGETPSAKTNTIDSYEMQSLGNASDFGDLTVTRRNFNNGGTNGSRGTFHGGNTPSVSDVIDYITIASVGNATDFGNLTVARDGSATFSSPTRTVSGGGYAGGELNVIDYITTASTGNATDFGDLTTARYLAGPVSSTIRGVWIAGYAPGRSDVMDYVTIASTGNALDFGDLAQARAAGAGISNNIRGVYAGGEVPGTDTTQIEFITIATTGNSSDFGDLVEACQYVSGTCDANSGLQSS